MTYAVSRENSSISIYFVCSVGRSVFVSLSECHRYLPPQWSAPTDVVADMAGAPWYDGSEIPVGKVLSPASMTSGKNNSVHHHNISFRLHIPKFLWSCDGSTSPGGLTEEDAGLWTVIITALCFVWIFPELTMAPKLAWSPHFLRPLDAVFAITPWNRESGGHMWTLVRGKLRGGSIWGGRDKQYFKTKWSDVWHMIQQWGRFTIVPQTYAQICS